MRVHLHFSKSTDCLCKRRVFKLTELGLRKTSQLLVLESDFKVNWLHKSIEEFLRVGFKYERFLRHSLYKNPYVLVELKLLSKVTQLVNPIGCIASQAVCKSAEKVTIQQKLALDCLYPLLFRRQIQLNLRSLDKSLH